MRLAGGLGLGLLLSACVAGGDRGVLQSSGAAAHAAAVPPPAPPPCPPDGRDFQIDGRLVQGGLVRGQAPACTRRLLFNGAAIPLASDGAFLLAFDRDAPAAATLTAERTDGTRIERSLAVAPGQWRIERVNAALTGRATSAEFRERRAVEQARIAAARAIRSASDGWRQAFVWPLKGRLSGWFGAQRIYRGTPAAYHGGADIVAPRGTPFVAPADGVVVLAAAEPFTLEGYLLIVDHGMGLASAFLHASSLAVKEGAIVRQGQVLGTVGATGRATGPHLHWALTWNAARIDPLGLVAR